MINTYSESSLHKTVKNLYADRYGGQTEQAVNGKICDVVTADGGIIEIQSGNLGKLTEKLRLLITDHPVRVIYPLCTVKYIETMQNGVIVSCRKSPKKQNIYALFAELTSLYELLLHPDFTLEVLESEITETRIKTDEPVQLINKSRRFRKNWYKTDKKLRNIESVRIFSTAEDYLTLLPGDLPEPFRTKDLAVTAGKHAHVTVWVLHKMGLLRPVGKNGRTHLYQRTDAPF
ncbi:hypothetical protein [Treponema brennaborense]|uniref:DUF8091 domain-containing protein n=1 Tax=Treponema brennaborense (strain DSM 12168 / CIP 105900 / DD5/3) TaxID=906968 RepID=F4LJI6_TREBD|nr:hypothetical protein [Treponema brennaborense]AEE16381.1 hypothetical protein Trebr_0945 [Treponema brennaborense DSM 12168]